MKILLLTEWLKNLGGIENFTIQLFLLLQELRFEVDVICIDKCINRKWQDSLGHNLIRLNTNEPIVGKILSLCERNQYNLLHAVPYERTSFLLLNEEFPIPIIGTEPSDGSNRCHWWYSGEILRKVINKFDLIHTFSSHAANNLIQFYNYCNPIIAIPPIVAIKNEQEWIPHSPKNYLLYFGRLAPEKGLDGILHALKLLEKELPNLKLDIWGEYSDSFEYLKNLKTSMGLSEKVFFRGPFSNLKQINLEKYDAYIFPSHFEGFPYTLIEAIKSGIPCISTTSNGVYSKFHDSDLILFCDDTILSIANAISQLYQRFDFYLNNVLDRRQMLDQLLDRNFLKNIYEKMYLRFQ